MNIGQRSLTSDDEGQTATNFESMKNQNVYVGIIMKDGYNLANLISIPLISASLTIASFYLAIQIVFILRDPEYFNVPKNEIGKVTNDLTFYSTFFQIFLVIVIGYVFDICGRKKTLILALLGSASTLFMLPYTAPNVWPGLYLLRASFAIFGTVGVCSPLVNDYVVKESRGKANAFQNIGIIVGELFNLFVVVKLTEDFSLKMRFQSVSLFLFFLVFVIAFLIKEPHIFSKKSRENSMSNIVLNQNDNYDYQEPSQGQGNIRKPQRVQYEIDTSFEEQSLSQKVKYLTNHVMWSFSHNIVFPVSYFGIILMRMNAVMVVTFYTLWISGFVGINLASQDEAAELFQRNLAIAVIVVVIILIPWAKVADTHKYKDIVPWTGTLNLLAIFAIQFISDPRTVYATFVFIMMSTSLFMQNLLTDTLFQKNIPKDIRGSMMGFYNFMGILAILVYSKIGGYLHDEYGSSYPFAFVGIVQVAFIVVIVTLSVSKKFDQ
eukprot:403355638